MSGLAFEIFRMPLNLRRKVPGTYVNGLWVEGSFTTIPITASVQPTTGEEMLSIPEGRRDRKTYSLFTSTEIEVIHTGANCDQITIFGELYDVVRVEVWQNNPPVFGIVNHYKFYASAVEAIP
jgi:hypothetical protein